ncbi:dCMP deaminase family protein [Candidatus Woesearchaeota archaeon]|nr:dCMP deaminase family protein [Candidatus Woesearchaeota archaeon]
MQRPDKITYYLNIAKEVSKRGTCLRRVYGAVLVKDDFILATGYNGAPRTLDNCCDRNFCIRNKLKIPAGQNYEKCRSVHAEVNCIIGAATSGTSIRGSTMYLFGWDWEKKEIARQNKPCSMCARVLINAQISKIICKSQNGYDILEISDLKEIAEQFMNSS